MPLLIVLWGPLSLKKYFWKQEKYEVYFSKIALANEAHF